MTATFAIEAPSRNTAGPAEKHVCDLQTTCQPPSAWVKDPWHATIRCIWPTGLTLFLERRFEKGSGLAIQLPSEDGDSSTVLARVTHLQSEGWGWLLEVKFISELSDDEVQQVLYLSELQQANLEAEMEAPSLPSKVQGVLFHAKLPAGGMLRWFVKNLDVEGGWPLPVNKVLQLRAEGLETPLRLRIHGCRQLGSYWFLECDLVSAPTIEELEALNGPSILP